VAVADDSSGIALMAQLRSVIHLCATLNRYFSWWYISSIHGRKFQHRRGPSRLVFEVSPLASRVAVLMLICTRPDVRIGAIAETSL
jgi:hypothetical protein